METIEGEWGEVEEEGKGDRRQDGSMVV